MPEPEALAQWNRHPTGTKHSNAWSERPGLTGAKGGGGFELTRVRADQGGFELTKVKGTPRRHGTAEKCQEMKKQRAVAPLSHRLDTLSRVEQPKQDWGGESAAQVRMTEVGMNVWAACACMVGS